MQNERKLILYIAMSLDGYIATSDDGLDFLSIVEEKDQDYGYNSFIETIDTVILGRKTYDKVLSMSTDFPHADKDAYIITRTARPPIGLVKFYIGNLKKLVSDLKNKPGKNIFVDGGAEVVNELLKDNLIDEFYISVIPVLLGDGISLFTNGRYEMKLKLVSSKSFPKGLVQMHYVRC